ncbi:MAG: hypothetical protein KKA32_00675 [Actinobacteria bacterium]|nr:hypothetical protein [Actinomycetota bacterium]
MASTSICPRCGHADTFTKGYLPDMCVCRVCLSQLGIEEIPGMGPDCRMVDGAPAGDATPSGSAAPAGDDPKAGE